MGSVGDVYGDDRAPALVPLHGRGLRPDQFAAHAHLERVLPAPALRPWVEHYWSVTWRLQDGESFTATTTSEPAVNLTVERGGVVRNGACGEVTWITGPVSTGRFAATLSGQGCVLGVKLTLGGVRAFPTTAELDLAALRERSSRSVRSVQRDFQRFVGVGAKRMLLRARVSDAVAALDRGSHIDLARLAADFGWYDQAHFTRDFRAVTGTTPRHLPWRPDTGVVIGFRASRHQVAAKPVAGRWPVGYEPGAVPGGWGSASFAADAVTRRRKATKAPFGGREGCFRGISAPARTPRSGRARHPAPGRGANPVDNSTRRWVQHPAPPREEATTLLG